MRRGNLIPGRVLLGFATAFEAAFGDPDTPSPYATIAPSRVGDALLPFACPRCGGVFPSCPKAREKYLDRRRDRGNYWCPKCGLRFYLDKEGVPLAGALPPGAETAPACVTRGRESTMQGTESLIGAAVRRLLGSPSRELEMLGSGK